MRAKDLSKVSSRWLFQELMWRQDIRFLRTGADGNCNVEMRYEAKPLTEDDAPMALIAAPMVWAELNRWGYPPDKEPFPGHKAAMEQHFLDVKRDRFRDGLLTVASVTIAALTGVGIMLIILYFNG